MDDILKISYNGQIKKIKLYVADEANEILKKYWSVSQILNK